MNDSVVIDVNNVSKSYRLYERPIDRLKETIDLRNKIYHKAFFALKDVSFTVNRGETIGILGRNGAGKSTLLKIITGVLTPSSGSVKVNGKIASLLELGAGFNPEFTGLENIYLNGTVMGYTKEEIDKRLPAILEFADIGDFVYQPVKTYSSGMYVRLAFSVAINVEPDILIVDEALAVGDARFQLKCFKRLEDLKASNTTIIFVSHAIEQIRTFCSRGLVLDNGRVIFAGDPKEAAVKYYDIIFPHESATEATDSSMEKKVSTTELTASISTDYCLEIFPDQISKVNSFGKGGANVEWIKIYGLKRPNIFEGGEKILIQAKYSWQQDFIQVMQFENNLVGDVGLGIALADAKGAYAFGCNNFDAEVFVDYKKSDFTIMQFEFVMPFLKSGNYFLTAAVSCGNMANHIQLKWYDYFSELECISCKKNVYGFMHLDYKLELV